ncbi:alpha/beta hydrolase [Ferrimonas pelagia]|uniref:Alpha/beta fold hydrolase n=1 Tax=Ferrimonas pelagia TaxID=1177826 RepID=A0ABP9F0L5_9GAMM
MTNIRQVGDIQVHLDGEGAETIVMIHGWPDTHRLWDPQVVLLKDRYRCARFSLPGFELGDRRQGRDLAQMIEVIDQVVTVVSDGKPVILMLHDWGSFYGYQYYMRHKASVSRIVSVDIGCTDPRHYTLSAKAMAFGWFYQNWLMWAWMIGGSVGDRMTRFMARRVHAPAATETIHAGMNYPYHWLWSHRYRRRSTGMKRLDITCPLLFIYGSDKPFLFHSQVWAQQMASKDGNQVVALPTGHWVMLEQPDAFNQTVKTWLASAT